MFVCMLCTVRLLAPFNAEPPLALLVDSFVTPVEHFFVRSQLCHSPVEHFFVRSALSPLWSTSLSGQLCHPCGALLCQVSFVTLMEHFLVDNFVSPVEHFFVRSALSPLWSTSSTGLSFVTPVEHFCVRSQLCHPSGVLLCQVSALSLPSEALLCQVSALSLPGGALLCQVSALSLPSGALLC